MKIGDSLKRDGQGYRCVGYAPHISDNGHGSIWVVLETRCAECGGRFRLSVPRSAVGAFKLNRRCTIHKRTGEPVQGGSPLRRRQHLAAMKRAKLELERMQRSAWLD